MTFSLSQASMANVTHVDLKMLAVAQQAIKLTTQDFGFQAEQSRTAAEELELFKKGYSHTLHSHHIIDCIAPGHWAAAGFSGAVDAVPWVNNGWLWATVPAAQQWDYIYPVALAFWRASLLTGIDITWGGCWNKLMSEYPMSAQLKTFADKLLPDNELVRFVSVIKQMHTGFDGPHFELGRN